MYSAIQRKCFGSFAHGEPLMRRIHRVVVLAALILALPALAGCENFDPDKLDVFHLNEKKKLPGTRKELFPEGVPGVTQGIPPEYLKSNQPAQDTALGTTPLPGAARPAKTASVEPVAEPRPKLKPKPRHKRKPRVASRPPAKAATQPAAQSQSNAQQGLEPWPASPPRQPAAKNADIQPWPGTKQQPANSGMASWPSAPPTGTFSQQRN
jgi:hypothetical protein